MYHPDPTYLYFLLQNDGDVEIAFVQAITSGNVDLFSNLIDKYTGNAKLLDIAVQNNQIEIVKLLLDRGLQSDSAIQLAIKDNKIECLKLLLEGKGEVKIQLEALENAIAQKNNIMVQMLVNRGYTHPSALSLAIKSHSMSIFVFFFENGFYDEGAFMSAIENNEPMMFKLIADRDGISPKDLELLKKRSIELRCTEILSYLLQSRSY